MLPWTNEYKIIINSTQTINSTGVTETWNIHAQVEQYSVKDTQHTNIVYDEETEQPSLQ